jgi:hypothetical protein
VQPPTQELVRGVGLHRNSSDDPAIQLACLDGPGDIGTPKTVTLKGFLRVFSSGSDSAGVKIEIYKEGKDGALGDLVGAADETSKDDVKNPPQTPKPAWLKKCPTDGCTFRGFEYAGIPTETPLIIKTSDAAGGEQWADLYDYNIFFANAAVQTGDSVSYDPAAVGRSKSKNQPSAAALIPGRR